MIKGHTKIELTNVETGETRVVESDNIFTDFFKDVFFNAQGVLSPEVNYCDNATSVDGYGYACLRNFPYKNVGGILCFENELVEDAVLTSIDFSNRITARGSDFAYTGTELSLGSFSVNESGFNEDGSYKMVWKFDETHGNGQISAVGLVSPFCARVGVGNTTNDTTTLTTNNEDDKYAANFKNINRKNSSIGGFHPDIYEAYYSQSEELRGTAYQYYTMMCYEQLLYLNGDKDEMYILARGKYSFIRTSAYSKGEFIKDCGYLRINKFRMPCRKVSIFDGYLSRYLGDEIVQIPDVIMTKLNTSTSNYIYGAIWNDNGAMYFILHPTNTIAVNETFYILKVNVDDFSVETITMKNTYTLAIALQQIYRNTDSSGFYPTVCSGNNEYFLFFDTTNKKFVRISLKDNTDIAILQKENSDFIFSHITSYFSCISYDGFNFIAFYSNEVFILNLKEKGNEVKYAGITSPQYIGVEAHSGTMNRAIPIYESFNDSKQVRKMLLGKTEPAFISSLLNTNYINNKWAALNASGFPQTVYSKIAHYDNLFTINNLGSPVVKTTSDTMTISYTLMEVDETSKEVS